MLPQAPTSPLCHSASSPKSANKFCCFTNLYLCPAGKRMAWYTFVGVCLQAENHNDIANPCSAFRSNCSEMNWQLTVVYCGMVFFQHQPTLMGSLIHRMANWALRHQQHHLLSTPWQLPVGSGGGNCLSLAQPEPQQPLTNSQICILRL